MIVIPLNSIPNQSIQIQLGGNNYKIEVRAIDNDSKIDNLFMTVSIERNDIKIVSNFRALTGTFVIPYKYLEDNSGNFAFFTSNGQYPNYNRFSIDQSFVYLTQEEVEESRV